MGLIAAILFVYVSVYQDFVKCENQELMDTVLVGFGDSLTLNCTYNCSSGFVRGHWLTKERESVLKKQEKGEHLCTVFLQLQNVSSKDLKTYQCYTEVTDATTTTQKKIIERVVQLKLRDPTCCESQAATHKTETTKPVAKDLSATEKPGMNDGMKVLAAVTITVAMVLAVLAVYLCLSRRRLGCNGKGHQNSVPMPKPPHASSTTLQLSKGPIPKQDRVTLRIPTPEMEGDPEVPYADIVISVRGASTPDLSQALYSNSADHNEWWGANPRAHLQAARSADVLHVPQPKEVSRKMSSNSEYAIIVFT